MTGNKSLHFSRDGRWKTRWSRLGNREGWARGFSVAPLLSRTFTATLRLERSRER